MAKSVMRPQMNCCSNPDPAWMRRDPVTKEKVHAYVCKNCGKEDRAETRNFLIRLKRTGELSGNSHQRRVGRRLVERLVA